LTIRDNLSLYSRIDCLFEQGPKFTDFLFRFRGESETTQRRGEGGDERRKFKVKKVKIKRVNQELCSRGRNVAEITVNEGTP
jgi:hypothetical protein